MSAVSPLDTAPSSDFGSRPTHEADRNTHLDVLRGFAVLGILIINIQVFSMIGAARSNPTAYGDLRGANYWVWLGGHVLADEKFMTIFSLLFGAGIVLMADRQEAAGRSASILHYRRMRWLLVIGLIHAYLLWEGDILVSYALSGMIVFWFRNRTPGGLLLLGTASMCVSAGILLWLGLVAPTWPQEYTTQVKNESWAPTQENIDQELAAYRGSWLDQLPRRATRAFVFQTFGFLMHYGWRTAGLMLMGMALYRLGVLTGERSRAFYAGLMVAGATLGVPLVIYGVHRNFEENWSLLYASFDGRHFNYWGSLLVSLAYVGMVCLACSVGSQTRLVQSLANVGRTALTNYVGQTILCTMIFYGHGFAQFGRWSRVMQLETVFAIWAFELVASTAWLHYWRMGPLEWLWRSLSYRALQPMRRKGVSDSQ